MSDIDLLSYLPHHKRVGTRWWAGPCPFCGGEDRFVVKVTERGQVWLCRGCASERYHTPTEFLQRYMGRPLHTSRFASSTIGLARPFGYASGLRAQDTTRHTRAISASPPPTHWQATMWRRLRSAKWRLCPDSPGGQYLLSRRLLPSTWRAFHLGEDQAYDPQAKCFRPAILIPYLDGDGQTLWAIKARFIDALAGGMRYTALVGSRPVLFGLHLCDPASHANLLIVEGELNALSIWQCGPEHTDVVSIGAEAPSTLTKHVLVALSRHYARTSVWLDDAEKAQRLAQEIGAARAWGSADDANALLQADALHAFLEAHLSTPCRGPHPLGMGTSLVVSEANLLEGHNTQDVHTPTENVSCVLCLAPGVVQSPDGAAFCDMHVAWARHNWGGRFRLNPRDVRCACGTEYDRALLDMCPTCGRLWKEG